jgi:tetratricopeptide (TPR) repeat protein
MSTRIQSLIASLLFATLCVVAHADEVEDPAEIEARKQEAFQAGAASIVDDLNYEFFDSFVGAINQQDMLDRIYGLRLIDQRIKRQFEENLEGSWAGLIMGRVVSGRGVPEEGLRFTLLGVESRGDLGRAVIRADLDNFQFNYFDFDLRLDQHEKVVIVDWINFLDGQAFSQGVGLYLVLAQPSKSALRKLLDFSNASERELFQFGELMKAGRDGNLAKFNELRDSIQPRFQRQRIVVESGVRVAKNVRRRREMVAALGIMAEHFPEEPLYSLMLLDHYFPQKKFEEGLAALQRLRDKLDVEDAAMDARMSAALLASGNPAEAAAYADLALGREPGLELGWLSALNARNAVGDFAGTVAALTQLEGEFDYDLSPETLEKSRVFGQLMASEEFAAWLETR